MSWENWRTFLDLVNKMNFMIRFEKFSLKIGDFLSIKDLSFTFESKWLYLILWPSGSWKTTFLKVLYILLKQKLWKDLKNFKSRQDWKKTLQIHLDNFRFINKFLSKQIRVDWTVILSEIETNLSIKFAYQEFNLIKDLSVEDNIFLFIKEYDKKRFKFLVDYFDIKHILTKKVECISWWEKARVTFVKAVLTRPKVLLVDETDSFLNTSLKEKFYNFLEEYSKDNLVIFVTHNDSLKIRFKYLTFGDV